MTVAVNVINIILFKMLAQLLPFLTEIDWSPYLRYDLPNGLYTLYFHFSVIYIIMITVINNNNNDMCNISKM